MQINKEQLEILANSGAWERIRPVFEQLKSEIKDITDIDKSLSWEWLAVIAWAKIIAWNKIQDFIEQMDRLKKIRHSMSRESLE